MHGNGEQRGGPLSRASVALLLVVVLVAQRLGTAVAQDCDAIFGEGEFSVTQAVLDEVEDDFQKIVDCVPNRGKLTLDPELSIKPTSTVVVNNPIELTSSEKGKKRPVFTCPGEGEPVFVISSTGVELKNFIVSDCVTESNITSTIVVNVEKSNRRQTTTLDINGVDFVDNTNLNGSASVYIQSLESLSLKKVKFSRNVGAYGGGVFLDSAGMTADVSDCTFDSNTAPFFGESMQGRGGGLFQNSSAFVTVTGSTFSNNYAENAAGAMYILGEPPASSTTIEDTIFRNNTAGKLIQATDKDGGAIWAKGPTLEFNMKNCTLTGNNATAQGGAIFFLTSKRPGEIKARIDDTRFEKNVALIGGALWAQSSIQWRLLVDIYDSTFSENVAMLQHVYPGSPFENATDFPFVDPGKGGAVTCIGISVALKSVRNVFKNNTAIGLGGLNQRGPQGGAISVSDAENVTIIDSEFRENSAVNLGTLGLEALGGAIHLSAKGFETARVLDAPPGSNCERQCNGESEEAALGISAPVAGCGLLDSNSRKVCALTNVTECEGVLPEERFIDFKDRPEVGAFCETVTINSNARISGTKFVDNVVHGTGGALFLTEKGLTLTLEKGVQFIRNRANRSTGGALVISEGATVFALEELQVKDNIAATHGGGISLEGVKANLTLKDALFVGNTAENGVGGAIASESADAAVKIEGASIFRENEAGDSGGAIACSSEKADITLEGTTFTKNAAVAAGGAVDAKSARGDVSISVLDVEFIENRIKASKEYPLVGKGGGMSLEGEAIGLSISGEGTVFRNNSAREGGGLRLFDTKTTTISQATFVNNLALSGGGLHVSFTKKDDTLALNLTDVEFIGNKAFIGGGIMADANSANLSFVPDDGLSEELFLPSALLRVPQLLLTRVRFTAQQIVKDGGGMFLVDIHAQGEDCDFTDNRVLEGFEGGGGGLKLTDFARLDLTSGRFTANRAVDGGAVAVSNAFFFGKDLELVNNFAFRHGGGIAVQGTPQKEQSMVNLEGGEIDGNGANFGGGIFVDVMATESADALQDLCVSRDSILNRIEQFSFVQNVVVDTCKNQNEVIPTLIPPVNLKNTKIAKNNATLAGGGVFTRSPRFVCACCGNKCDDEYCTPDGLDASFPKSSCKDTWKGNKLGENGYGGMVASSGFSGEMIKPDGLLLEDDEFLDTSHNSGQTMASVKVQMKDYFGQDVTVTRENVFARLGTTGGQILSGQVDTPVVRGVANFNATILTAFPGNYNMNLSFPSQNVKGTRFKVTVRECMRGENPSGGDLSASFVCRQCEANSFSFNPNQACKSCPASTTCDTMSLTPIDGYWHSSSWSQVVHKCLVDIACSYDGRAELLKRTSEESGNVPLSFKSSNYSLCRQGYEGPLCGSCARGFGRVRAFECQECLSKLKAIPLMVMMVFWIVIIVGFIIRNALKAGTPMRARVQSRVALQESAPGPGGTVQTPPVIYLGVNPATENAKILINFLQITSIALVINVEWREEVRQALEIGDIASGLSANGGILSFDCPLEESSVPISIRRTILAVLLPLGMMVFPSFFLMRGYFNKAKSQFFYRQAFVSCLVVAYVFYTGMTKRALRILHGVSVDPEGTEYAFAAGRFWADDTKIGYFEGDHAYLAILLGLPVLLFYSFGFPGYLFYVLWGNKEKLNDESFARSYGFLYRAYHIKYVYWEIVVMARKALLVGVVVFVYELGGNLQSVFAVMVLMAALVLHLISQPYREELAQMNHRETLSLCVSVYTYLVGIAFNDSRLPVWSKVLLSTVLLIATTSLVIYLLCALVAESARHLKTLLEERDVTVPEDATTAHKMRLLLNYYWFRIMDRFWRFTERGVQWSKDKKKLQQDSRV